MSTSTDIAPGKILLSIVDNGGGNNFYQYTMYDGTTGIVPVTVMESMNILENELPVLIDTDVFVKAIDLNKTKITDLVIQMSNKADTEFVKKLNQQKLNISKFTEFLGKAATIDAVDEMLSHKADSGEMEIALNNKADKSSVYTIDELHSVLFQFIGARGVRTIQERDALEYAINPFVWVLDASGDPDPVVESPAFYKWNSNHWVYIGTIGHFITGGGGGGSVDLSNYYNKGQVDRIIQAEAESRSIADAETVDQLNIHIESVQVISGLVYSHENDIVQLKEKTSLHDSCINEINSSLDDIDSSIDSANASIDRIDSSVTNIGSSINVIHSSIDAADSSIANHEDRISSLEENGTGGGEQVDLTPINGRLDDVEQRLSAAESTLESVEDTLGHLDTGVTTLLSEEFAVRFDDDVS